MSTTPPAPYYPYGYYQGPTTPKQQVGDKLKDHPCPKCKNKGHVVIARIENYKPTRFCKLCGHEETEK